MKKSFILVSVFMLLIGLTGLMPKTTEAKQKTVCIDAGHQKKANNGKEPVAPGSKVMKTKVSSGTQGVATKKPEYVLNLEVSLKLGDALAKKGYKVVMTRTKHDVNLSNVQRAQYCNKQKADLSIRIHADGNTNRSVQGMHVLYPSGKVTKAINTKSKDASSKVLNHLIKNTKAKKLGSGLSPRSDITGFNWSTTPVILIEMGFMSNAAEDRKLATASYQNLIVKGTVDGVNQYFGVK